MAGKKRKPGRKTKFNKSLMKKLCKHHANGNPLKTCAELEGITRKTLYEWLKQGEKAKSGLKKEFFLDWQKAHAKYKSKLHQGIMESDDWRAKRYLLECADPDYYVTTEKRQTSVRADVDVKTDLKLKFDDEVQRRILDERAKHDG